MDTEKSGSAEIVAPSGLADEPPTTSAQPAGPSERELARVIDREDIAHENTGRSSLICRTAFFSSIALIAFRCISQLTLGLIIFAGPGNASESIQGVMSAVRGVETWVGLLLTIVVVVFGILGARSGMRVRGTWMAWFALGVGSFMVAAQLTGLVSRTLAPR